MAYFFAAPRDQVTARTSPLPHPGNKLMRHFAPLTRGRTVYIAGGVATDAHPGTDTVTRTFVGGAEPEPVTAAEKVILEAGGFTVTDLDAVMAEAVVLLRASAVTEPYTPGDPWLNEGTAGSASDGEVNEWADPTFIADGETYGPAFSFGAGARFVLPHDDVWNADVQSDARTFLVDVRPTIDTYVRNLAHYPSSSLPVSGRGLVLETHAGEGDDLLFACYDGTDYGAVFGPSLPLLERRVLVVRLDPEEALLTLFSDGEVVDTASTALVGDIGATASVNLGSGQMLYRVAAWDRALTDTEVASVSEVT